MRDESVQAEVIRVHVHASRGGLHDIYIMYLQSALIEPRRSRQIQPSNQVSHCRNCGSGGVALEYLRCRGEQLRKGGDQATLRPGVPTADVAAEQLRRGPDRRGEDEVVEDAQEGEDGHGSVHSDGTGQGLTTLAKMIVKDVGGSFLVQQEGGQWGFVQLAANDYVLLPTVQGVTVSGNNTRSRYK